MSERVVCRPCLTATGALVAVVARPWPEGGGGDWVCEGSAAHVVGGYADGGTLDLGVVRDPGDVQAQRAPFGDTSLAWCPTCQGWAKPHVHPASP